MNSMFLLIKANIINSWGINKALKSKSSAERLKTILLGLLIVYAFGMLAFTMFMLYYPLGNALAELNSLELLIGSSILSTTLFSLFMSIYKIPGYLFSFRDFDLLMSLPVKPSAVLASKMIFVYLSNLAISILAGIPSLVIYGIKTHSGPIYYVFAAVATLFVPLIPISIGAVLAYILGRISSKFRSTNVLMLIGTFVIIIAFMVLPNMITGINQEQVQSAIPAISGVIKVLFWTNLYIKALSSTNLLYMAAFLIVSVAIFSAFIYIFAKGFKTINSKMSERYKSSNYKITSLKASGVMRALYIKEFKFYLSSYIYVTNTAVGVIMMLVFSLAVAVFGKDKVAMMLELPMAGSYVAPAIALVFAFCISFTFVTASSISLEGKNLWIIKSLPLKIENILWSKILLNMTLTIPALIVNMVIVAFAFKLSTETIIVLFLLLLLLCIVSPVMGILVNLYFPKLEWTSQVAAVKQSASVFITMIINVIIIGIPAVLFILIKPSNTNLFMELVCVFLAILAFVLIKALSTIGVKKFKEL
ncbi:putative ABC transporter permease subunit [Ruminiclostridium josui]|uniref:putative ABC transporter permease subunit n=1 Tax=Ruminiclostridium josui TaxID=1499 RepID=UPI0004644DE1|nr:ABC transporter permease [Ruminiclostridium josui]